MMLLSHLKHRFSTELFTPGLWNSTIKQDNQQRNESPGYDFIVL
jgi:hypothetical protein